MYSLSHQIHSAPAAPRKRRPRTSLQQLAILQEAYTLDPMPCAAYREMLSTMVGLSSRSIQIWFQNRRQKLKLEENSATLEALNIKKEKATTILNSAFKLNPNPSDAELESLAEQVSISAKSIKVWYENRQSKSAVEITSNYKLQSTTQGPTTNLISNPKPPQPQYFAPNGNQNDSVKLENFFSTNNSNGVMFPILTQNQQQFLQQEMSPTNINPTSTVNFNHNNMFTDSPSIQTSTSTTTIQFDQSATFSDSPTTRTSFESKLLMESPLVSPFLTDMPSVEDFQFTFNPLPPLYSNQSFENLAALGTEGSNPSFSPASLQQQLHPSQLFNQHIQSTNSVNPLSQNMHNISNSNGSLPAQSIVYPKMFMDPANTPTAVQTNSERGCNSTSGGCNPSFFQNWGFLSHAFQSTQSSVVKQHMDQDHLQSLLEKPLPSLFGSEGTENISHDNFESMTF
ncbi:hypothetical protein BC833DRAFT_581815 [Globomyces pollinis-pini]|nr:hypothetical protein BC833DRAFT_581815 [Globomyces pollinis-pini]